MKVAIFLNSGIKTQRTVLADKVICADAGYDFCPVKPDVIIGDGDSISNLPEGIKYVSHNPHKDDSDGTLSVRYAIEEMGATEIDLYGVLGGRIDHMLGNFTLMSLALSLGVECIAKENDLDVFISNGSFELDVTSDDLISVVPLGGDALIKSYSGLEYPLVDLRLTSKDTRGISNVATSKKITLDVVEGEVLIFHYYK